MLIISFKGEQLNACLSEIWSKFVPAVNNPALAEEMRLKALNVLTWVGSSSLGLIEHDYLANYISVSLISSSFFFFLLLSSSSSTLPPSYWSVQVKIAMVLVTG